MSCIYFGGRQPDGQAAVCVCNRTFRQEPELKFKKYYKFKSTNEINHDKQIDHFGGSTVTNIVSATFC